MHPYPILIIPNKFWVMHIIVYSWGLIEKDSGYTLY